MVGRDAEVDILTRALTSARIGSPQLLLVEGAAGMGKTRLISEFLSAQADLNPIVVAGDANETSLQFGLVGQILPSSASPWSDPFAAGAAVLRFIGNQPADVPVVLVVDDAHLADNASLVALSFTVRRLGRDHVLVVLGVRSDRVSALPPGLLAPAERAGRMSLRGLTDVDVAELAGKLRCGRLSGRAAARLRDHTGGNPLHTIALLNEVPAPDLEAMMRPLPAPSSFRMLVLGDLAGTSTVARRIASAASVLGERAAVTDILQVAEVTSAAAVDAVEELDRVHVLRLPAGDGIAHFDHALVRSAIYDDLGPGTRSRLHLRAAACTAGLGALRHRVSAAIGPDIDLATDLETEAVTQIGNGNLLAAGDLALAASRVTSPGPESDRRLLMGVESLLMAGDLAAAEAYAGRVAEIEESGRRLFVQAWMAWLGGRGEQALSLAQQAWVSVDDLDEDARDRVAAMRALIEMRGDHPAEAAVWAERALAGERLDPATATFTRATRAFGLATSGDPEGALRFLSSLPTDPDAVGPERHPELSARGLARMLTADLAAAEADLSVAASMAQGDLLLFRLAAGGIWAETKFRSGDWQSSSAVAERYLALAEDMGQTWVTGLLHAIASWVPSGWGDWPTAEAHVMAARAAARETGDVDTSVFAEDAAVFLAACRADPNDVMRQAERLRMTREGTHREPSMFAWPVHVAAALVELGRLDEAETELDEMRRLAESRKCRSRLAAIMRVSGQLAAARRRIDDARSCYAQALTLGESHAWALERAVTHDALGRLLRRRGERRAAIEQLLKARSRFIALSAAPFLQRCNDELAACGVAEEDVNLPRDCLTPQERAVAMLVCAGRTNREVADELVVSVKTVGYHLANVYTKLGVHSRVHLLKAMEERLD